jgi:2-methylisocitrate lyase-like PEP mutase family enzyme
MIASHSIILEPGSSCKLVPGVANPLSARIAEDLGYEILYVTGAGVSNFAMGVPDIGLMTLNDMAEAVTAISAVVGLPLIVDADTGFGNAVNAYHAVRRLEAAGAGAIQLEDQLFPKKCGHFENKAVIPAGEMTDKIKAAVDARRDSALKIIARTDARAVEDFGAVIDRAEAYAEAGADILFLEALTNAEEIEAAPARVSRPAIINVVFGGKTPARPLAEFDAMGYAFALYANAALQAAIQGMQRVLGVLKSEGQLSSVADYLAPFSERQRLVRKNMYDEIEARYTNQG